MIETIEDQILAAERRVDSLNRSSRMLLTDHEEEGYSTLASIASVLRYDSHNINTSQATSSQSFTDLATVGPSLSILTGQTGKLLIIASAQIDASATGVGGATYGGQVGVHTVEHFADSSPDDTEEASEHAVFGMSVEATLDGVDLIVGTSTEMLLTFEPGSTIDLKMQYKSIYGNSISFDARSVLAIPL